MLLSHIDNLFQWLLLIISVGYLFKSYYMSDVFKLNDSFVFYQHFGGSLILLSTKNDNV